MIESIEAFTSKVYDLELYSKSIEQFFKLYGSELIEQFVKV